MTKEEQEELEFLRYFYDNAKCGMGPADSDIYAYIKEEYIERTGKALPRRYRIEDDY